jgi:hypothetical protein
MENQKKDAHYIRPMVIYYKDLHVNLWNYHF